MTAPREPAAEHPPRRRRLPLALAVALGQPAPVVASSATARRFLAGVADLDAAGQAAALEAARYAGHGRPGPHPRPGDITAFEEARRT
jgi:hypothetical protein